MSILQNLREAVETGGVLASLSKQTLEINDQYVRGELSREEYEYLLKEIRDVKSQQDLAQDEIACRWICAAIDVLLAAV